MTRHDGTGTAVDERGRRPHASTDAETLDEIVDRRRIRTVFQPLVELATGEVTGYECLSRGPAGTPLESPTALFTAAEKHDRLAELDWVCRSAALSAATDAGGSPSLTWFVNVEPKGLATTCPADLLPAVVRAERRLRVVLELTERHVGRDPATILAAAAAARANGWGVALDDVGADASSLALLPFLQPDIVKLDLSLVQGRNGAETAAISNAVRAYAETTGAVVLAEGIEDDSMARLALVLGATHGQGWHFGRPGPLPPRLPVPEHPFPLEQRVPEEALTPFQVACSARTPGRATKALLLPNSHHLERQAEAGGETLVLLASFQDGRHFTAATRRRYLRLAERNVFTAAIGASMPSAVVPGVRTVGLAGGDPLAREWNVIVVGPHFAGALLARDCGDAGPDAERRFDYVITHERPLVLRAARSILRWVTAGNP